MAFKNFKTIVKDAYSTNLMKSKYVKLLGRIFFLADQQKQQFTYFWKQNCLIVYSCRCQLCHENFAVWLTWHL